jgi:hypothetical protein
VKATTPGDYFSKAGDVSLALIVIEDVEEAAIEHGVELLAQINEANVLRVKIEPSEPHLPITVCRSGCG